MTSELTGIKEKVIESTKDIFDFCYIIETKRATRSTSKNDTSSRSHCVAEIKLYTKVGADSVHINSLRFFDLAGFERAAQMTKEEGMSQMKHFEGVMTNWTLYELTRSLNSVIDLKKPLTGGEEIPRGVVWKMFSLSRLLKASYNGAAFTSSIFCIS